MKKLLTILATLSLCIATYAQDNNAEEKNSDTENSVPKTTFNLGSSDVLKDESWSRFGGLDIGFAQMLNDVPAGDLVPGKSLYWGFNIANFFAEIAGPKQGFETGFGFFIQSRTFEDQQPSNFTLLELSDPNIDRFKQKYRSFGLHVPAMLTFNLGEEKDKSFFISAGVIGRYYIGTSYKEKLFYDGEKNRKVKESGDFGIEPLQLDATIRFGTGAIAVFANYGITSFYDNRDANLFTFGLAGSFK